MDVGLRSRLSEETQSVYDIIAKEHSSDTISQDIVTQLFNDIAQVVQARPNDDKLKKEVAALFFDHLSQLPEHLFDRTVISGHPIEKILVDRFDEKHQGKKLSELRKEYKELLEKNTASKKEVGEVLLQLIEKEARFALSLGVRPDIGGGGSTAYELRDISGKKIAIFKPDDEGPRAENNPKIESKISKVFFEWMLRMNSIRQSQQSVGEAATYKIGLSLGTEIVPPTTIIDIEEGLLKGTSSHKSKKGSMQTFMTGFQPASEALEINEKPSWGNILIKSLEKGLQQVVPKVLKKHIVHDSSRIIKADDAISKDFYGRMAVMDFLTGQVDRHYGNFMVQTQIPDAQDSTLTVQVDRICHTGDLAHACVLIDNGASQPKGYVTGEIEGRYQYCWTELDLSQNHLVDCVGEKTAQEIRKNMQDLTGATLDITKEGPLKDFLDVALKADFGDSKTPREALYVAIQDPRFIREDGHIIRMPTQGELQKILSEQGVSLGKKDLSKFQKNVYQVLGMRERAFVLDRFLDPENTEYTIKELAKLKSRNDFKKFFKKT